GGWARMSFVVEAKQERGSGAEEKGEGGDNNMVEGATGSGGGTATFMSSLVPSFDPAKDNVELWSQKVELLVGVWPKEKLSELVMRLILNTSGTAFQKLQLHRDELQSNDLKAVRRLIEIVGGTWGQVPLEKRFELAEKVLYKIQQKPDETNDSYLARADIAWTELLQKKMDLPQLQAYITLRNSNLAGEDKKRVLVESGAEKEVTLTMEKVTAAVRMLGTSFFQDYTGQKKNRTKVYDQATLMAEEEIENDDQEIYVTETNEDEMLETLAMEGDEDAVLITQFEEAVTESIQNDQELATYYTTYAAVSIEEQMPEALLTVPEMALTEDGKLCHESPSKVEYPESATSIIHDVCFASNGTLGVLDLGASQTVMGSAQVAEFLQGLPNIVRSRVRRSPCQMTFRFGNQETLCSQHALIIPLDAQGTCARIAIVPGRTPFLISNSLLCALEAVVDTKKRMLYLGRYHKQIHMKLSNRNLFLVDFCDFVSAEKAIPSGRHTTACDQTTAMKACTVLMTCDPQTETKVLSREQVQSRPLDRTDRPRIPAVQEHVQKRMEDNSKTPIADMDLEELETCVISFGDTKKGMIFPKAFQDMAWTTFVVSRFQNSEKREHQEFLRYVQLRVEMDEKKEVIDKSVQFLRTKGYPKAKAKSMSQHSTMHSHEEPVLPEEEPDEWEALVEQETGEHTNREEMNMLQSRMLYMENALQEVIGHLRNLTANSGHVTEPQ
ncbi:unnamed protein product, partial [Effrenium voratum]